MNKLKWLWSSLQASFWFVPSPIVAGSIAVAVALIEADSTGSREWLTRCPHLFGANAAGARARSLRRSVTRMDPADRPPNQQPVKVKI